MVTRMATTPNPTRNLPGAPARLLGAAAAALASSGACADQGPVSRLLFPKSAATYASDNDDVMLFVFWVSLFFFVLLMGLMAYWAVRYRRRPGVPQQRSPSHSLALELLWSGIPLILCCVMFWWGFKIYMHMHVTPAKAEVVNVTAKKWAWTWEYGNGGSSTETVRLADKESPVYVVPQGRPIKLLMHSQDVIHSLYIPAFRKKIDVMPNRYTTYWFNATEPGDYNLFCAEYCGDQHSQMMALIQVKPEAEYQAWLAELVNTDRFSLLDLGKKLYITKGCNACHSVDGSAGTGPSWKGIYMKEHEMTDGARLTADENYIRESILVPAAHIVKGFANQMPSFQGQLKDRELGALITYIKSLSDNGKDEVDRAVKQDDAEREERMKSKGKPNAAAPQDAPAAPVAAR